MNFTMIILSIYLIIGLLIGFIVIKGAEWMADKHEKGEQLSEQELEMLESMSEMYQVGGEKRIILLILVSVAVLWPVILFEGITGKGD